MDQSIRLRRPEDGPSPYCAQSAQPLHSGPERAQQAGYGGHERKVVAFIGGTSLESRRQTNYAFTTGSPDAIRTDLGDRRFAVIDLTREE